MNKRQKREAREALFDDLANDRTTPEDAEAKARELGLKPLKPTLDPAHFDPLRESHWTLAMAVSWTAWRDLERVRDCLPGWREQHQSWLWREYRPDGAGALSRRWGWFLEQTHKGEAPFLFLQICEALDASEGRLPDAAQRHTIHHARLMLWEKLGAGELTGTTVFNGAPHVIPAHEWPLLRSGESHERDVLYLDRNSWRGPRYDSDVLLPRADVLRLWPAEAPKRRGRKPSVGPEAKAHIDAMRAAGVAVDAMSHKELARALEGRGVRAKPRTAGRARRA